MDEQWEDSRSSSSLSLLLLRQVAFPVLHTRTIDLDLVALFLRFSGPKLAIMAFQAPIVGVRHLSDH